MKPTWKYDEKNIPVLSAEQVEAQAQVVLDYFGEGHGYPIPVHPFLERLQSEAFLTIRFVPLIERPEVLGRINLVDRQIWIRENLLEHPERLRLVLAHELGHFVFHRHRPVLRDIYDGVDQLRLLDMAKCHTPSDWAEWQANRFASALLMPRHLFHDKLVVEQERQGNIGRAGSVFVDTQPENLRNYYRLKRALAEAFQVPQISVKIRLVQLEKLTDTRLDRGSLHISGVLTKVFQDIVDRV